MTLYSPPSYQYYHRDMEASTKFFTLEEFGAYQRLLNAQWAVGFIPDDPRKVAAALGVTHEKMAEIWPTLEPKFPIIGAGKRANPRLEKVRESQQKFRDSKARAGRKGADARWRKDGTANNTANDTASSEAIGTANSGANGKRDGKTMASCLLSSDSSLLSSDTEEPIGSSAAEGGVEDAPAEAKGERKARKLSKNQLEIQRAEKMWTDHGLTSPDPKRLVAMRKEAGGIENLIQCLRHVGRSGLERGADYVTKAVLNYAKGRKKVRNELRSAMQAMEEIEEEAIRAAAS